MIAGALTRRELLATAVAIGFGHRAADTLAQSARYAYSFGWGGAGSSNGRFDGPRGVAIFGERVYIADSGLACYLLGIETVAELARSPFAGAIFEGFVAAEIAKHQTNHGGRRELYYFRDEQGLEVDFVIPRKGGGLSLVECKATRTVRPAQATPMLRLIAAVKARRPRGPVRAFLVHEPSRASVSTHALVPGVKALPWTELVERL